MVTRAARFCDHPSCKKQLDDKPSQYSICSLCNRDVCNEHNTIVVVVTVSVLTHLHGDTRLCKNCLNFVQHFGQRCSNAKLHGTKADQELIEPIENAFKALKTQLETVLRAEYAKASLVKGPGNE